MIRRLASYQARLGSEARRLGWTFSVHRTDHAPQTALLALHAAVSAWRDCIVFIPLWFDKFTMTGMIQSRHPEPVGMMAVSRKPMELG